MNNSTSEMSDEDAVNVEEIRVPPGFRVSFLVNPTTRVLTGVRYLRITSPQLSLPLRVEEALPVSEHRVTGERTRLRFSLTTSEKPSG